MSAVMQIAELAKRDVTTVATGYRSSKGVGTNVRNHADQIIGKIDDLMVGPDGEQPFAVLSVGGFMGRGTHLVVLPCDSLRPVNAKLTLPGGSEEGLRALPEFRYATE